jgi:selenocysteine-specific elongation factor
MLLGPLREILAGLVEGGEVLNLSPKLFIHCETCRDVRQKLLDIVGEFHRSKPESPGMSSEQLLEASRLKKDIFDCLVEKLVSQDGLVERKHCLALPEHKETFSDDEQQLLHSVESLFKARLFDPPGYEEVVEHTKADPEVIRKMFKILIEQEQLVRVDKDLFFHREAVEQARQILTSYINKEGGLESVKFKYLLNTTRKFAIPLLDYFDRIGVTRRSGYTRYLRVSN